MKYHKLSQNMITDAIAMLFIIFSFFLNIPSVIHCTPLLQKLPVPSPGPVSFAFDLLGRGPYTGVLDGRILRYRGPNIGFVDFAYTSPNRTKAICDGINNTVTLGLTCGRPLYLDFYHRTGELFTTDAFYGLLVVGSNGGLATQLATSANGVPFGYPVGLVVDQLTGIVYFLDLSATYGYNQLDQLISTQDSTGRLLKYDRPTGTVTVLLSGLAAPIGVAISRDRSFLLVSEFFNNRILRYWLKGPKANTTEVFKNFNGGPGNIKRTTFGNYWVAVTAQNPNSLTGQKFDRSGNILQTLTFSPEFNATFILEVQEYKGLLYLGSLDLGYVGVYRP